jgi:hypothetical protein
MKFVRFSIAGLLASVVACGYGMACLRYASAPWAQALYSIALGLLVLALIGIACRAGSRRTFWTGFAIAGWSYLLVATGPWFHDTLSRRLVTTRLLDWAYPVLIPRDDRLPRDARMFDYNVNQKGPVYTGDLADLKDASVSVFERNLILKDDTLLIECATVLGMPRMVGQASLRVDIDGFRQLQQVQNAGIEIKLVPRGPFASMWLTPPVGMDEFREVGHSIVAILCACLGGLVGRHLYATRARVS